MQPKPAAAKKQYKQAGNYTVCALPANKHPACQAYLCKGAKLVNFSPACTTVHPQANQHPLHTYSVKTL